MSPVGWQSLSEWYNACLDADADERERIRARLSAERPELARALDELVAEGSAPAGFLEQPAIVVAAPLLAEERPPFEPGTRFGPYRIDALLGRGGMGDVYRATDSRLNRQVALKTLSHDGTEDHPHRVERFVHEARVTAALDHPNIVRVFDVGVSNGRPYLVTELLEGETLRARLLRSPVPPEQARRLAMDVASGLIAAHADGLVHRDLKPENLFLTAVGPTKILDFGIAKLGHDPTLSNGVATLTGLVLGTAGYLAPEQITGDTVDARSDLFALGSILFEALTGQRAFARGRTIDTLHAIVHDRPPDLPAHVPPALVGVVMRLLQKAPDDRFQTAAELRTALEPAGEPPARARVWPRLRPQWRPAVRRRSMVTAALLLATLLGAALGWLLRERTSPASADLPLMRVPWSLPGDAVLDSAPIVSPDGERVAFTAMMGGERPHLFVKANDSLAPTAIAGTEGARHPFWSADGEALGFFADRQLKRVSLDGGLPVPLAPAPDGRGGAWSPSGTIVFSPNLIFAGLARVDVIRPGAVQPATVLDVDQGENSHRFPVMLPDGIHFLYFVKASVDDRRGVYVGRLDRPASTPAAMLYRSESEADFVATSNGEGVLVSASGGAVEVRRLDLARMTVGDARRLPVAAGASGPYHSMMVSASSRLLAAVGMAMPYGVRMGRVPRAGGAPVLGEFGMHGFLRFSPDGRRLARQTIDPVRANPDIYVHNLDDGSDIRISKGPHIDLSPVWSRDAEGRQLAFGSGLGAAWHLTIAASDGSTVPSERPCPAAAPFCEPTDWSLDGRMLFVNTGSAPADRTSSDIWLVPVDAGGEAKPLLPQAYPKYDARLAPDGRSIAYVAEERPGRPEVFLRAFTGAEWRLAVSANGGTQPVWRHDGRELFYLDSDGALKVRTVAWNGSGRPALGPEKSLPVPPIAAGHWGPQYDVSADGDVHYIDRRPPEKPREMLLIQGWQALLTRDSR